MYGMEKQIAEYNAKIKRAKNSAYKMELAFARDILIKKLNESKVKYLKA
jgi:flagellar hook-associated protein FlgK